MEDDDEFGDLYTDVLRPLQSFSVPEPPPIRSKQPSPDRPINLNFQTGDDDLLHRDSKSKPDFSFTSHHQNQNLASDSTKRSTAPPPSSDLNSGDKQEGRELAMSASGATNSTSIVSGTTIPRVSISDRETTMEKRSILDPIPADESAIDVVIEGRDQRDDVLAQDGEDLTGTELNFGNFDGDAAAEQIPGISGVVGNQSQTNLGTNLGMQAEASAEADDWDSDSEDDLQIVLNDDNPENVLMGGGEDGDPLNVLGEGDPGHQLMEDQDWGGEDAAQAADGERKEPGDAAAKANGGVAVAPKIGFSHQTYHPYHSQFKYIRPGAAPIPGAAPVGPASAPGNFRPPVNAGLVAGRGRGDWWATATRNASPMQKGLHPGFGVAGRGSGIGLDFTLPSHKPIFEVDIDTFEEKPWKLPGIDVSDFFNFGFNEDSWKEYCKQVEQLRLEGTMQSKIRVYESGRVQQEYDPDLPPELAAASGIRGITSENANAEKVDAPQSEVEKGSPLVRPTLPIGRAIQVEISSVERFPTMDTRQPRMRDLDAIIEIVLQDNPDDAKEQPGNVSSGEDSRGGHATRGDVAEETVTRSDGSPHPYNGGKRDFVGKRTPPGDSVHDDLSERERTASPPRASVRYPHNSTGQSSAYPAKDIDRRHEERQRKRTSGNRSPNISNSEISREDSVESIGAKQSRHLSSPDNIKRDEELSSEEGNNLNGEMRRTSRNSKPNRQVHDPAATGNNRTDESPPHSVKKQKLGSRVDQERSSNQVREDADLKSGRSREDSRARSGSGRDHQKLRSSVDEEFVQHMESSRRSYTEDEQSLRRKGHDGRHDTEKQRLGTRDRESSYPHRDRDPRSSLYTHGRTEGVDRRKALESSERVWRLDEEPHGRKTGGEDTRKRDRADEIGAGHRNKARDGERREEEEHLSRKQLDYGSSRDYYHKDLRLQHKERDDHAKSRYDTLDDPHGKRRKEMEISRRDAEKEILRGRDNTGRRKQERDDALDLRKKDNHAKTREDSRHSVKQKGDVDPHSIRHREDGRTHGERGERHTITQSREGSLSKPEREGRRGVKSGRVVEDKSRVSHAALTDKSSDRDYQSKEAGRRSEKHKRSDPIADGTLVQHRASRDAHEHENRAKNDDRRSRQEPSSTRNGRAVNISDNNNNREQENKHKENARKRKESEGADQSSMVPSKNTREARSDQISELATSKSTTEGRNSEPQPSKKHKVEALSDDEQKDSRRGRSKLERWTSNEERDFTIAPKPSSLKVIEEVNFDNGPQSLEPSKVGDESSATVIESADNQNPPEDQNAVDKHLDTVEKLKKRSERFKLPMPSEKEAVTSKKTETDPSLPSPQNEAGPESDIKTERPARKRRWISS